MSLRILVVEDQPDAAMLMKTLLELHGKLVFLAHDGIEAVGKARELRPDVILMDMTLPKLDGLSVVKLIRAHDWGQKILVVALTGYGSEEDKRRSLLAGCRHHLVKPVDPAHLLRVLDGELCAA